MIHRLLDDDQLWNHLRKEFKKHALNIRLMEYTTLVDLISQLYIAEIRDHIHEALKMYITEADYMPIQGDHCGKND